MIREWSIMRECSVKQSSRRIVCMIAAILIASTFSACKKGTSYSHISPASITTDTTDSVSETQPAAATTTTEAQAAAAAGDITVGWCNGDGVHIRKGAGTDYYSNGALYTGDKVTILGKEGDWYKIRYAKGDNGVGYVNAQFISATEVAAKPSSAAATTTTAAAQ